MGTPMGARLLAAGHTLDVYSRTPEHTAQLVLGGASVRESIRAVARDSEVVISMLPDDKALWEVSLADGGLIHVLEPGQIHLVMGTHSPAAIASLETAHRRAGQDLVAAPVLGRPEAAREGRLVVLVAGADPATARCESLLGAVGERTYIVGEHPQTAAALKLVHNFVLACAIECLGEAASAAKAFGLSVALLMEVLTENLFACPAYRTYGQIIQGERYGDGGFPAALGLKDLELLVDAVGQLGVSLPSAVPAVSHLTAAIAHGQSASDWSVVACEQSNEVVPPATQLGES